MNVSCLPGQYSKINASTISELPKLTHLDISNNNVVKCGTINKCEVLKKLYARRLQQLDISNDSIRMVDFRGSKNCKIASNNLEMLDGKRVVQTEKME